MLNENRPFGQTLGSSRDDIVFSECLQHCGPRQEHVEPILEQGQCQEWEYSILDSGDYDCQDRVDVKTGRNTGRTDQPLGWRTSTKRKPSELKGEYREEEQPHPERREREGRQRRNN